MVNCFCGAEDEHQQPSGVVRYETKGGAKLSTTLHISYGQRLHTYFTVYRMIVISASLRLIRLSKHSS